MKKNKGVAYIILASVFALFNVIAFAVPTDKTATFWIVYSFTIIAFALQLLVWKFSFKSTDTLKSKFLGIPLIHIGIVYLIIQLIAFAAFMLFPTIPSWLCIIICALIVGVSAICLIGVKAGTNEIDRVEAKVEKKVFYIKSLQVDVEMLAEKESDADIKASLLKLAEKIKYSDPMTNGALADIENAISEKIKTIQGSDNKVKLIEEIDLLITERNKKAKLLK